MATGRTEETGIVRPWLFCSAVCACVVLCLSGLGYVWHRNRNAQLSRELQKRAAYLEAVWKQNQQLDRVLEELRSPRALQAAVQKWQLGLGAPDQVLAVQDPGKSCNSLATAVGLSRGKLDKVVASKNEGADSE